jgi:trimeric autotransporter adhesin
MNTSASRPALPRLLKAAYRRFTRGFRDESSAVVSGTGAKHGEEGNTLVEVLITLIIMSLATVALMSGFATTIMGSAEHRSLTTYDTLVVYTSQEAIAQIQQDTALFTSCPTTPVTYYQSQVPLTVPSQFTSNYSAAITGVQYWNGTAFTSTCKENQPQQITVTITRTGAGAGLVSYSNTFDVSYPLAPSSVTSSTAAQLVFYQEPGNGAGGTPLSPQPVVIVEDAKGTPVTTDLSPVTLAITGNTGSLTNCSGSEVTGVVTFSGCTIGTAGTYTLTASDGSLPTAVSTSITVSAAPPSLVFTTQPVAGLSGNALSTMPVIKVETSTGTVVTSSTATITLTSSSGVLTGCSGLTAVSGVVNVAGCSFAGLVGTYYTLTASSTNLVSGTSNSITPSGPGTATQLSFTTEPSGAAGTAATTNFTTNPVVTAQDSAGNIATAYTTAIVLTASGTNAITCSPSDTVTPSSGVATYSSCHVAAYANGITLKATSGSLTTTSTSFNVTGLPSKMLFSTQPVAGISGTALTTQPVVTITDSNNNLVTAEATTITLSSSGGTLSLCSGLTTITGVVNVASCSFAGLVGTNYTLTAVSSGLPSVTSSSFSPTGPGAATQLVYTTQPVAGASESTLSTQPVIKVEDSGGNVVTSASDTLSLSVAPSNSALSNCSNLTTIAGVATVTGCTFAGSETTSYTMTASSGALAPAASSAFSPTAPGSPSQIILSGCATSIVWNTSCQVAAQVQDQYNNVETGYTGNITFAQPSGSGALTGLGSVPAVSGAASATLTGYTIGTANITASIVTPSVTSASLPITITPAPQTISWTPPTSKTWVAGGAGTFPLGSASDSSGAAVTFASSTPSVCSVSGSTATMLTAGTCTITPTAPAYGNYALTAGNPSNITINQIAQATLTMSSAASDTYPYAITLATTGGSGTGAVTYAVTDGTATGCADTSGTVTASTSGTCLVTATKAADVDYFSTTSSQQTVTFSKAASAITITSTAPVAAAVGGSTYTASASSTSGDAVVIASSTATVCTVSGSTVTFIATGQCTLTFNDAGNANYSAATQATQSFTVYKGTQATLSINSASSDTYPYSITLSTTGGSGTGAVTYAVTNGTATGCTDPSGVLTASSSGTCLVTATKAADGDYFSASSTQQTVTFSKATQSITFASNPGFVSKGGYPYTPVATSSSGLTVTVTSATTSICTISSGNVSFAAAGTCTLDANQAGNGGYSAAAQVTQSITVVNLAFTAGASGSATDSATVTTSSATTTTTGSPILVLVAFTSTNSSTACGTTITASSGGTLTAVTQLDAQNWGSGSLDGLCAYEATAGSTSETVRDSFTGTAPTDSTIDVFQITGDSEAISVSATGDLNSSANSSPIFNGSTPAPGGMEVLFAAAASSSVTDSSVPSGFTLEQGTAVSPGLAEADLFGSGTTWPLTATNMLSSSQFWGTITIDVNP